MFRKKAKAIIGLTLSDSHLEQVENAQIIC